MPAARTARQLVPRVGASLLASFVALAYLTHRWPLRWALSACLVLAVGALVQAHATWSRLRGMLPFLVLSAALALAPAIGQGRPPGFYEMAILGLSPLAGWVALAWLALPEGPASPPGQALAVRWPGALALVLGLATVGVAAALHRAFSGHFAVLQDESLLLLQSDWFAHGRLGWTVDRQLLPALQPEYTFYRNGTLYTQYPPGWPLLLACFGAVHLRWWASPVLAGVTVVATYHLGRRLHSPLAGLLGASLLAAQAWFLAQGVGYLSHLAGMACLTIAAVLVAPRQASARHRPLAWVGGGALLGAAVAIRPLTGVTMTLALALWVAALRPGDRAEWTARIGLVALGAFAPLAGLLVYNWQTTGQALTFGYEAVHGSLHALGFGQRGFLLHGGGPDLLPAAESFTPAVAAARLGQQLWDISIRLLPVGMLVPLLWWAEDSGQPVRWRCVWPYLLLPGAYFFYFFNAPIRFMSEGVPFALVGIGCLLGELAGRGRQAAVMALAGCLMAVNILASIALWDDGRRGRYGTIILPSAEAITAAGREAGPIAVFITEPAPEWYLFRRLSFFNGEGLAGNIVVARDLGEASRRQLLERLPGHVPYQAVWAGPGLPLGLSPLPGRERAPTTSGPSSQ